jgi:hypothetical protein
MVLRRAWINFGLLWSVALIATGAIFLLLAGIGLAAHGHATMPRWACAPDLAQRARARKG